MTCTFDVLGIEILYRYRLNVRYYATYLDMDPDTSVSYPQLAIYYKKNH